MSEPMGILGKCRGLNITYLGDPQKVTLRDGSTAEARQIHRVQVGGEGDIYFVGSPVRRPDADEGEL